MKNIEEVTLLGHARWQDREIQGSVNSGVKKQVIPARPVIVSCRDSRVWFGYYSSHTGCEVTLIDARMMYKWVPKEGVTLSGCANYGIDPEASKIVGKVGKVILLEACEIIYCTDVAEKSLVGAPCAK